MCMGAFQLSPVGEKKVGHVGFVLLVDGGVGRNSGV